MFFPDLIATFPFDLLPMALLNTPDYHETVFYKVG
mgnify:CR=1 FL=1